MSQDILKWGNSLAFRIPAAIAKQMGIAAGAKVELRLDGNRLIVERHEDTPTFTHQALLKALRKAKKTTVEWGPPRGREVL
jgi:antitoxin component of MazEF toxin-antitoxin module